MRRYTVDKIMGMLTCDDYTRDRVAALVGDGVTANDVLLLPIPARDRWWLLCRVTTRWQARLLAATCARLALERERDAGREPDPRCWAAVDTAEAHALGLSSDEDLAAAREEAWNAVREEAHVAACDEAWRAARDAAYREASDAAWKAASEAVCEVAWKASCEKPQDAAWTTAWNVALAAAWDELLSVAADLLGLWRRRRAA